MTIRLPPTSVRTPSCIVPSYLLTDSYGSHLAQVSTRSFSIFKKSSSLIRWAMGPLQILRNAFWSLLFSDGRLCFTFHPSILVHSVSWRSINPLVSLTLGSSTIPSECRRTSQIVQWQYCSKDMAISYLLDVKDLQRSPARQAE